ncbi:cytochrome P450 [Catelliglobosispora koreensis]|uniref:cytochrome P450 n=1 Tax=Catelliglobosispora koreensis TaxID=129052 RepID=UPI0003617116|nr:cytochrome P450 [Catelliglobosispora koreensis]
MIPRAESPFLVRSVSPTGLGSTLAEHGRERPVVFDELMGAPLVLRHKDVSAALRDTKTFSTQFYGMGPMATAMIAHDGVEHARQRRIHNRFFSASASARYAEIVRPIAQQAFGGLSGKRESELIGDVLAAYPMKVFLELLGVRDDVGDQGLAWVRAIISWLGSPMDESLTAPGLKAFAEISEYTTRLVEHERAHPSDNMLGEIVKAHVDEGEYTPEAVTVAVVSLLLGGFETTIQMLTGTIAALLLNDEALQRVRADASLYDAALDEAFRWASPSAGLYRLVLRDTEIGGTAVKSGSMVYLCIAAAHFDGDVYADPAAFTLGRPGTHLGFGLGPHYCVGAPLARIEARAALAALLAMFPELRLDPAAEPSFFYGARGFVQHGSEELRVLL